MEEEEVFLRNEVAPEAWWPDLQILIIEGRLEGKTYVDIKATLPIKLCDTNIITCLRLTAKGFRYTNQYCFEPPNAYLCPADESDLKDTIVLSNSYMTPMSLADVIEEAYITKCTRQSQGISLLIKYNCPKIVDELITAEIEHPSASWVKSFGKRNEIQIKTSRSMRVDRILGCQKTIIEHFFAEHESIIRTAEPAWLFGADETMLNGNSVSKIVAPTESRSSFSIDAEFPHMTAMLSHNVIGAVVDPFVVIPKLSRMTPELKTIYQSGKISIAANSKSWMTS
jgi:hypothetical protein